MPSPHRGQRKILAERGRFNVVDCGRRFGKTILGENLLIPTALAGYPVGWFAPSYKYLYEVWDDFLRILAPLKPASNKSEWRIELKTGGTLEFWSLRDNPDAGRSRKYKRVVVDEAAKVGNLEKCWNEAIRATLTDMKGEADFLSTPKGIDFFFKAFTWGQAVDKPEWRSWKMPTETNPHIDPAEIEAARLGLPARVFEQEYLAEFLDDAGGVFRGVSAAVDKGRHKGDEPAPGKSYSMGVDLARVADFTVISVLDQSGRQAYHERFNQISWERQIAAIAAASARFNRAKVYLDCTGVGDPIFEALRKAGVPVSGYQFTNASKEALIDNLAMKIERRELRLMDLPEQTQELLAYQYELTASRNVRMNAPDGMHDDCVIALALSAWGLGKGPRYKVLF